jgi:hypothetical protein
MSALNQLSIIERAGHKVALMNEQAQVLDITANATR